MEHVLHGRGAVSRGCWVFLAPVGMPTRTTCGLLRWAPRRFSPTEHFDRGLSTTRPCDFDETLTVNGKAELVVQDAESYQELLKKADFADTAAAIHRGMKSHRRGEGKNMRKALEDIAQEAGFELE